MMPMPFGNPSTYEGHSGVDFGQPTGAVIKASASGVVVNSGYWNSRAGFATVIQYPDCKVLYCHQPENVWRPGEGSGVVLGSGIGSVGSTGFSTGPHLHMEILEGRGAGTYAGIWNYFDRNSVVGDASGAGEGSAPIDNNDLDSDMIRIQAPGRGIALIGPGYYRPLSNDEEVHASGAIISKHVSGNDRQFDLWVSLAFAGRSALPDGEELGKMVWDRELPAMDENFAYTEKRFKARDYQASTNAGVNKLLAE